MCILNRLIPYIIYSSIISVPNYYLLKIRLILYKKFKYFVKYNNNKI